MRRFAPLLICAVTMATSDAFGLPRRRSVRGIIVVSIDSLRPDHLGCYGYPKGTSPRLDALARQASRFERHISAATWTKPSDMSILTSVLPSVHGVYSQSPPRSVRRRLNDGLATLAEVLRRNGYATAGFVASNKLDEVNGFARGFDVYRLRHHARARAQNEAALAWLRSQTDRKFFLFLHYYDLHSMEDTEGVPADTRLYHCGGPEALNFLPPATSTSPVLLSDVSSREPFFLTSSEAASAAGEYDGCIRYIDEELGRFFDELARAGRLDSSLVIVTSDHGEAFGEGGYLGHRASTLAPILIHVPLLIKAAGQREGSVYAGLTSSLDLMPTVLEAAGVRLGGALGAQMQGRSLWADLRAGGPRDRAVFAEETRRPLRAVIASDGWELARDLESGAGTLYDLDRGPAGAIDLQARPQEAAKLEALLDSAPHAEIRNELPTEPDEELRKRIQRTGYW